MNTKHLGAAQLDVAKKFFLFGWNKFLKVSASASVTPKNSKII